ncbi:MAG: magnesium/cobalt transporter CorA [Crocinitomix sp.]|nr:magnesium/cobalt transporter CorA [Crocinitomix sp.]
MTDSTRKISKKAGLPPGTLVHIGEKRSDHVKISVIDYTPEKINEIVCTSANEIRQFKNEDSISWINIDGVHDLDLIQKIGDDFKLHHLVMEDIVNTDHRPKLEEFDDYIFLSIKMLGISPNKKEVVSEQVSFILGDSWILSFQEQEGDIFDDLRERMRLNKGLLRQKPVDYLLYRLIDTIVDNYFFVTENFSEMSEHLEEEVLTDPSESVLASVQQLKRQILTFKKSIYPLREAVSSIYKNDNRISAENQRYFIDVYDHIIQLYENVESQREVIASIRDLYLSGMSNKMNQIMKVLTIIATIFIPLTFVAGIYGMNFDKMPELHWENGYAMVWILMGVMLVIMLVFFRRKKWL